MARSRQNTVPLDENFFVDGIEAPVRMKRNSRARRFILRINESRREVNLTIPEQSSEKAALDFLNRNHEWVKSRLEKLPACTPFQEGAVIPLRGISYQIHFVEKNSDNRIVRVYRSFVADEMPKLFVAGLKDHAPRRLKDWLKKQARIDLKKQVDYHAARLALTPKRLTVRDQKSRWGSCSSTGALAFSWRLILAPEKVLDYVAAHEVAHLQEMNHGPDFWKLVKRTMPDYERAQEWLREHGAGLHRYGTDL
ncbi:MAG: M48 family metallopeptidase [Methyloligellaceae bacterium]